MVVFEDYGRSFGASLSAAMVMRDLAIKIDFLADLMRDNNPQAPALPGAQVPATEQFANETESVLLASDITFTQDVLADPMDMAYSVDNSGLIETLWPPIGNMSDHWLFHTQAPRLDVIDGTYAG
jgi:hypothetical protein